MSASNREKAIAITLKYEGGYTNHPSDPGGPTNWGITIHDAKKYWKPDATASDVKGMPKSVAIDIYRQKYWAKMSCDDDPAGVDLVTFDYGVNSGPGRAIPCRAKNKSSDPVAWVKGICRQRLSFVRSLRTWSVFGKGWGNRIADVEARGVKMALESLKLPPPVVKEELEKEAKKAETKVTTNSTTAGTAGGGVVAGNTPGAPTYDWNSLSDLQQIGVVLVSVAVLAVAFFAIRSAVIHYKRKKAYQNVAND